MQLAGKTLDHTCLQVGVYIREVARPCQQQGKWAVHSQGSSGSETHLDV